jgi:hypothetical protein
MLCDHSRPTPAMHTMPTQLRPHAPVKPRKSALIPIVTTRLPEAGPPTPGSSLGTQEYPHRPTHIFPAHFVLTHARPGRTSRSVTHRSKPSTLNFGVFSDGLPENKLQLIGMSILINPIKPWAGMSHGPTKLWSVEQTCIRRV